ncbi:MAG: hypothetical protein N3A58_04110 [Spirochaetes bacterium]|nr:hypothetical protein [Spirochaetota bacterium]
MIINIILIVYLILGVLYTALSKQSNIILFFFYFTFSFGLSLIKNIAYKDSKSPFIKYLQYFASLIFITIMYINLYFFQFKYILGVNFSLLFAQGVYFFYTLLPLSALLDILFERFRNR